ncbi:MAG TPA: prolipoprotein diacylglyceryl transferase family protein [Polyangiaceae bacterium]|nr:prolipoprotein diacylglyceryl transferase family protein [Polyangiaceae bacterium]
MHPDALILGAPNGPFGLRIEPFGGFLAVGLALGVLLARRLAQRSGFFLGEGLAALGAALLGSLIGARVVHWAFGAESGWRALLALGSGGLSGYGALFGAALGAALALRSSPARAGWFDVGACGALLGISMGRLGCYLAGSDFGRAISGPVPKWLARLSSFPHPRGAEVSEVWFAQTLKGAVNSGSLRTPALHPTALYEAAGALVVLAALLASRTRQRAAGQSALVATVALAVLRFAVDGFRGGVESDRFAASSLDRAAAVLSVLAACAVLAWRKVHRSSSAE